MWSDHCICDCVAHTKKFRQINIHKCHIGLLCKAIKIKIALTIWIVMMNIMITGAKGPASSTGTHNIIFVYKHRSSKSQR